MDNHDVARVLNEIGTLLELKGENPFRIRAYHNAARALENLEERLEDVLREGRLEEIEGIGQRIAKKITRLVATGRLPYYEKLKKSLPAGLIDLLKVPSLGPKKAALLYKKLNIKTTKELIAACREGKVATIRGFGEKTQKTLLNGLSKMNIYGKRRLWWDANELAKPILEALKKLKGVKKAEIAGSLRRKLETVGDVDFLVASPTSAPIIEWFTSQSFVAKVVVKGKKKATVRLKEGLQADLRIIPENQFAFALLYFTGSKAHNIKLRQRSLQMGFSLSEYGFEPIKKSRALLPKKRIEESAIYKALRLYPIPPELREDRGEIEFAEKRKIPRLIEEKDIRGLFHSHTADSDGHNSLEEMVRAAEEMRLEYIGISDHSKSSFQANGMNEKRLLEQIQRIHQLNRGKKYSTYIFSGLECDILKNGKLDFPDSLLKELDFVIIASHQFFKSSEKEMTARLVKAIENPRTTMVAHPTGRLLLQREPYSIDLPTIIDACIANGKIMELNAHPMRLDMDWRLWHKAAEKGLKCSINPDAHAIEDLKYFRMGVSIARKGWLEKRHVINTQSLAAIKRTLKHTV